MKRTTPGGIFFCQRAGCHILLPRFSGILPIHAVVFAYSGNPLFIQGCRGRRAGFKQPCLLDKSVELPSASNEFGWSIELSYSAAIKHNNPIAVQNGVDTVSDRYDRAVLEDTTPQHLLQEGIGFNINSGLD